MNYLRKFGFANLLILPVTAEAHPGAHSSVDGIMAALSHLLTQPDHLLLLAGAVLCGIYLFRKIRRGKSPDSPI